MYIDRLCPRAQKGYSNTKYCQEVLIGLEDAIEKCNYAIKGLCTLSRHEKSVGLAIA
jgi:hypothetical protein